MELSDDTARIIEAFGSDSITEEKVIEMLKGKRLHAMMGTIERGLDLSPTVSSEAKTYLTSSMVSLALRNDEHIFGPGYKAIEKVIVTHDSSSIGDVDSMGIIDAIIPAYLCLISNFMRLHQGICANSISVMEGTDDDKLREFMDRVNRGEGIDHEEAMSSITSLDYASGWKEGEAGKEEWEVYQSYALALSSLIDAMGVLYEVSKS